MTDAPDPRSTSQPSEPGDDKTGGQCFLCHPSSRRLVMLLVAALILIPAFYFGVRPLARAWFGEFPSTARSVTQAFGEDRPGPLSQFNTKNLQVAEDQLMSGGPPKDGIPSLTDPRMVPVSDAGYLDADDRIVTVEVDGDVGAYPLSILNFHECVNDTLGGKPIAVIYCPLCDSVSVVDRRLGGKTLEFGISGLLMNSNVVFYDRTDNALWSQVGLTALSGPHAGESLTHLDGWAMTTVGEWRQAHPEGQIVSKNTGHSRNYARNPYGSYFNSPELMFPVSREDDRLATKARVLGIKLGSVARAYPLDHVRQAQGSSITDTIEGKTIQVKAAGDGLRVVQAPEAAQVVHTFWFAWAAFHPDTTIYEP